MEDPDEEGKAEKEGTLNEVDLLVQDLDEPKEHSDGSGSTAAPRGPDDVRAFAREAVVGFAVLLLDDVDGTNRVDRGFGRIDEELSARRAVMALDLYRWELYMSTGDGAVTRHPLMECRFKQLRADPSVLEMSERTGNLWIGPQVLLGFHSAGIAKEFETGVELLKGLLEQKATHKLKFQPQEGLSAEDLENLESFGVTVRGLTPKHLPRRTKTREEEEEEDNWENTGNYWTFSYMVWGILICLDMPLSWFALLLSEQPDLALFAQALCILFQCVLLAWFKPFDVSGINYYAICAGMLEFGLAASGGFLALFTKFVNTPLGEAYRWYVPVLESTASSFTMGIMIWTLGLLFGKLAAASVEKMRKQWEEEKEGEEKDGDDEPTAADDAGGGPATKATS